MSSITRCYMQPFFLGGGLLVYYESTTGEKLIYYVHDLCMGENT